MLSVTQWMLAEIQPPPACTPPPVECWCFFRQIQQSCWDYQLPSVTCFVIHKTHVCFCSGLITWCLLLPVERERAVRTISGGVTVWAAPFRWPCEVNVWVWVLLFSFVYYTTCDRWKCDTNYYVAAILCFYCCSAKWASDVGYVSGDVIPSYFFLWCHCVSRRTLFMNGDV